ncbi:MAG: hypothetical protein K8F36_10240 [Melioribacteraceae bacterium]|nr:hypothetical protein [Melioribacteraceae bacterium]
MKIVILRPDVFYWVEESQIKTIFRQKLGLRFFTPLRSVQNDSSATYSTGRQATFLAFNGNDSLVSCATYAKVDGNNLLMQKT